MFMQLWRLNLCMDPTVIEYSGQPYLIWDTLSISAHLRYHQTTVGPQNPLHIRYHPGREIHMVQRHADEDHIHAAGGQDRLPVKGDILGT
jgi:hypothetical protein